MKRFLMKAMAIAALAAGSARAQTEDLPTTSNAAFGYWRAFSQLETKDLDEGVDRALIDVVTGKSRWNEKQLRPVIDRHLGALHEFHRAAKKPVCDFGLDYGDGFAMTMPHLAKARALAKVAAAEAEALADAGHGADAVAGWLDGLALARHIAEDRVIISILVARVIWSWNIGGLHRHVGTGTADAGDLARIEAALAQAPVGGFDWATGLRTERIVALRMFDGMIVSADPAAALRDLGGSLGEPGAGNVGTPPSDEELAEVAGVLGVSVAELKDPAALRKLFGLWRDEYAGLMGEMEALLAAPPWESPAKLEALMVRAGKSNPLVQMLMPALGRVGQLRQVCEAERAGVLGLVRIELKTREGNGEVTSLAGLAIPPDPFTGEPFSLRRSKETIEVWSTGKDSDGNALVFRLKR
ncbi:MAG: hypothetical protein HUU15_00870 [Candidatus Brocadiae bacterium]|nr:hypothetical protein [Candidatus Brocadiia bacterium]